MILIARGNTGEVHDNVHVRSRSQGLSLFTAFEVIVLIAQVVAPQLVTFDTNWLQLQLASSSHCAILVVTIAYQLLSSTSNTIPCLSAAAQNAACWGPQRLMPALGLQCLPAQLQSCMMTLC